MKKDEITLKNTKSEILEALNEALERERNLEKAKFEPKKEEEKNKTENAIKVTRENVEQNIFSEELNSKFKNLEIAVKAEEDKLKDLYGIEEELSNLVIVINEGKDYMAKLENEKKIKTEEVSEDIRKLEETYSNKKEELEKEYDIKLRSLKIERDRENEEYIYKLKRDREIANNKWEDEKNQREKILTEKEEKAKAILEEAETKKKYIEDLENKVEQIPTLLEKEYERGKKEATVEIQKDNKYTIELLKKDFQNTIDRQNDKIESLKEEVQKSNQEKESLQNKLDQAYNQIKEMATKTVEATGGVKILGNNSNDTNK